MANSKDFIDESELGNWVEAPARGPIVPGQQVAAPPVGDSLPTGSRYFSGTLAPQLQHDVHFVDAGAASPRLPSHDLMPLAPLAAINSAQIQAVIKIIQQSTPAPAPVVSGGSINGTVSNPFIPYASAADTLSDSTWEFTPSGNVLSNAQSSSTIDMIGAGGNEVTLANNGAGSFPTYLSMGDSDGGSVFLALRPSTHEAIFSLSDSAGDGVTIDAENGFGCNTQWVAASLVDNIILDVNTNSELFQMESGLGGLIIWSLDTDGSSDWEQADSVGNFAEVFQSGGVPSYFTIQDSTNANSATIDINKSGAGTAVLTLKSPAPSINFNLGSGGPSLTVTSTTPTGTPVPGSLHINTSGLHSALTLLSIYDSVSGWVGIA